jgi:hypothetical protein
VRSNRFVVGMNRSSPEAFKQRTGLTDEDLAGLASWPSRSEEEDAAERAATDRVTEDQNANE